MPQLIDNNYGWYGLYRSQAQDAGVKPGARVHRRSRPHGWMSYNFDFDAAWFQANGFHIPPLYAPDELVIQQVDIGFGPTTVIMTPRPTLLDELRDAWRYNVPIAWLTRQAHYVITAAALAVITAVVLLIATLA
jgi:hypothetical protein